MSLSSRSLTHIIFPKLTAVVPSTGDVPQCSMCSSMMSQYCANCNSASYCSKTCLKADLPVHQLLCAVSRPPKGNRAYGNGEMAPPTFYGVLFPAKDKNPCWVTYMGNYLPGHMYSYQTRRNRQNPSHPAIQILGILESPLTIAGNALRSRSRACDKLELYYGTSSPSQQSTVNHSVLSATYQRPAKSWYGPLLAVKVAVPATIETYQRVPPPLPVYLDMDMVDFRDIIDLLCTHPAIDINDMTNAIAIAASTPKLEVSAVRINCPGDQALGRAPFELVTIRADDAACRAPVTAISRLIEFPVRVSRCLPPHTAGYDAESHNLINPAATDLLIGVDPASDWGFVGIEWVDPAGSVFVVREGGEKLDPQHVEALCHWCLYVLRPLFEDSLGMGRNPEDPMEKEKVLVRIVKREWDCFYTGFDRWKGCVDKTWVVGRWPC